MPPTANLRGRDRPGRNSQCIHFGPLEPELRLQYLNHYLRNYDCSRLDLERLAKDFKGATQAFLKGAAFRTSLKRSQSALSSTKNESGREMSCGPFSDDPRAGVREKT